MLLNMPGQRLQLAAIQMEQPPAALTYHVRVQVAVGVVTDILIAGGSSFGREKAAQAAKSVKGRVVYPFFKTTQEATYPTDFNDLLCLDGAAAVHHQLFKIWGITHG